MVDNNVPSAIILTMYSVINTDLVITNCIRLHVASTPPHDVAQF